MTVVAEPPTLRSKQRESKLHGKTILLPGNPTFRPSTEQLVWHNDHVYRPA